MRPAAVTVFGGPTSRSPFDVWLAWVAGGCVFTRSVEDSGRTAFFLQVNCKRENELSVVANHHYLRRRSVF